MSKKALVIYSRFSSDMQRADSCSDQEREVRGGLIRFEVPCDDALVLRDEAESGTKTDREGFQQLCGMIRRGEVGVLAVYDQSRLTRGENALAVIQDLVFAGGRFVAVSEGIDTLRDGWEVLVQVKQIQHGQTIRSLQGGVRRGQRGGCRRTVVRGITRTGTRAISWTPTGKPNSPAVVRSRRKGSVCVRRRRSG